jgi:hypothetical protein
MKPNIETLPCFVQVAKVIGRDRAVIELEAVLEADCSIDDSPNIVDAFDWIDTYQGDYFWLRISEGINPYTGEKVE